MSIGNDDKSPDEKNLRSQVYGLTYSLSVKYVPGDEQLGRSQIMSATDKPFDVQTDQLRIMINDRLFAAKIANLASCHPSEKEQKVIPAVERPPGHQMIIILQTVLPKSVFDRVYGQMVADMRDEYYQAEQCGDHAEAKKIKRHLNFSLVMSIVTYVAGLPFHLLSKPFKMFDKSE